MCDTVVAQHQLEVRREILTADGVNDDTRVLFHLLNQGLLDKEVMDRPCQADMTFYRVDTKSQVGMTK